MKTIVLTCAYDKERGGWLKVLCPECGEIIPRGIEAGQFWEVLEQGQNVVCWRCLADEPVPPPEDFEDDLPFEDPPVDEDPDPRRPFTLADAGYGHGDFL